MKILLALLSIVTAAGAALADIPAAKNGEKPQDAGLCAGVLLSVAAILIFGRWGLKKKER